MAEKVISDDNNGYKTVKTESIKEYRYANGSIKVKTVKTVYPDGTTDIEQIYSPQGELPELPRLGAVFTIDGNYSNLSWYGRGPGESYPDRKTSMTIGRWESTVKDTYTHYPRPQDSGNHEDVVEVILKNRQGKGIKVAALDSPFSFTALNYTSQDLAETSHDYKLTPREDVILSIDAQVLGLGNSSCGPGVLKKYSIDKNKEHTLKIRITNL